MFPFAMSLELESFLLRMYKVNDAKMQSLTVCGSDGKGTYISCSCVNAVFTIIISGRPTDEVVAIMSTLTLTPLPTVEGDIRALDLLFPPEDPLNLIWDTNSPTYVDLSEQNVELCNRPSKGRKTNPKRSGGSSREKALERNRVAANKCRQKKREYTKSLESQFKDLAGRRTVLRNESAGLRCELLSLKGEILKHAHCDDGRVEHHLARKMRDIQQCTCLSGPETSTDAAETSPSTTSMESLNTELLDPYLDPMVLPTSEEPSSFLTDDHFDEFMNA